MKRLLPSFLMSMFFITAAQAITCPDPKYSSLRWGEPPPPWEVNPFSPNPSYGEADVQFIRATILVGGLGRGIICTYRSPSREYSIWQQVLVKIPSRQDYRWVESYSGYVCSNALEECQFYIAN